MALRVCCASEATFNAAYFNSICIINNSICDSFRLPGIFRASVLCLGYFLAFGDMLSDKTDAYHQIVSEIIIHFRDAALIWSGEDVRLNQVPSHS